MKTIIKLTVLMCLITSWTYAQKVNYLGASPRGISWKQNINFEASLGVLYPLAVPIKITGGVNFMDINYKVSTPNTDTPTDEVPTTDEDLPAKFSTSKKPVGLNSTSIAAFDFNKSSNETGFYLGLALADVNLSDKLGLQPEARFVAVKDFNQIQLPLLVSYAISDKFNALAGPNVAFLLNTGDGIKSTNFAIDFGLSYKLSESITLGARYNWGQTNLLEGGGSDNHLKINNIQVGMSYQIGN